MPLKPRKSRPSHDMTTYVPLSTNKDLETDLKPICFLSFNNCVNVHKIAPSLTEHRECGQTSKKRHIEEPQATVHENIWEMYQEKARRCAPPRKRSAKWTATDLLFGEDSRGRTDCKSLRTPHHKVKRLLLLAWTVGTGQWMKVISYQKKKNKCRAL